jgi:hypothetical protein
MNIFTLATLGMSTFMGLFTGPVFKPLTEEVNFGEVKYGADVVREYTFTNAGDENLLLTACTPSCGCTTPEWPKNPIRPGEKGVIKVKYDTKRVGEIHKSLTITTNEVDRVNDDGTKTYKSYTVMVTGKILPAPSN